MGISTVEYGRPVSLGKATNADIDTTEEDVLIVTDNILLSKSQLTFFVDYVLGTHTSMDLRFFYRAQADGDWYQVPKKNTADGTIDDNPFTIDANSPAARLVIEFPMGACYALKVTADGVGGADGSVTVKAMARNN